MGTALVEVESFSYRYPRTAAPVLQDISLTIREGEFVGLVGPTGAGKTTLCLALAGLVPGILGGQVTGQVRLAGEVIGSRELGDILFPAATASALVGITFQDPEAQLVGMTVEEDLAFGPENLGLAPEEIYQRIHEVLRLIRMEPYRDTFPYTLSGGQKQRVGIGSTLALRPRFLILDEPTSELDPVGRSEIFAIIRELKEAANLAILVVEHHTEELAQFADRLVVLHEGRILLDGPTDEVFQQEEVLKMVGVRRPEGMEFLAALRVAGLLDSPPGVMTEEQIVAYLGAYLQDGC